MWCTVWAGASVGPRRDPPAPLGAQQAAAQRRCQRYDGAAGRHRRPVALCFQRPKPPGLNEGLDVVDNAEIPFMYIR